MPSPALLPGQGEKGSVGVYGLWRVEEVIINIETTVCVNNMNMG